MFKVYRAKLCKVSVLNYPRTFLDITPVSNVVVPLRLFVRIKSMHRGLGDLKQVGSLTILAKLKLSIKYFISLSLFCSLGLPLTAY